MTEYLDRLGRPYTPFMLPELKLGRKPPNFGKRYPAEVYGPAELERLMRAAGDSRIAAMAARDQAAIAVMWRGGLRIAEACALEPRDIDQETGLLEVRRGKGHKRRLIALDPQALEVVKEWRHHRGQLKEVPPELFCNVLRPYQGLGLTPVQLRKALKRLAEKAEIRRRMHPHGLRHTFAFELKREGVPDPIIQGLLGHSQLQTTLHYVNHTLPGEYALTISRRRWPGRVARHAEAATRAVHVLRPIEDLGHDVGELRARVAELEQAVAERDRAIVAMATRAA